MPNITLSPDQQTALEALQAFISDQATSPSLAVLEGFAGTGKSTLVAFLLHTLPANINVAVMAPTHKAVGVMEAAMAKADIPVQAKTEFGSLHSFLGLRLRDREDGSQSCDKEGDPTLYAYDLAIVDECSMVSEQLFEFILRHKRSCKVLFVGDPAQLPPVNDNGKDSPAFRMVGMKLRLNNIIRQAADNPIIASSVVVRQSIEDARRICLADIVQTFPSTGNCTVGVMTGGLQAITSAIVFESQNDRDCRAISWRNDGVRAINARVHTALYPSCPTPFAQGETVIAQTEFKTIDRVRIFTSEELTVIDIHPDVHPRFKFAKCYRVGLERVSGELVDVYVAADEQEIQRVVKQLWNEYRELKAQNDNKCSSISEKAYALDRAFAPLRHSYAMTAHKSQGSTFDTAILDWDDFMGQRNDFEFNRMVYVAMTRASKYLAIVTR